MKPKFCFFVGTDRHHDEVIIFRQAITLQQAGFDVEYVVCDDEPDEVIHGVKVSSSGYRPTNYFQRIFIAPFFLIKKLKQVNADVYQTCSIEQVRAAIRLKRKGKHILFHMRELHPYTYMDKSKKPIWQKKIIVSLMVLYLKRRLNKFNAVIAVSDANMEYLKRWGIERLFFQGNFPSVNNDYALTFEEYSKRENRIIYYGSIYGISCQEYILDALNQVEHVKYLLAGRFCGNETYHKRLENHLQWRKVEFIDGFKLDELPSLLRKATISNVLRDFTKTGSKNGSLGIIKIFESMEAALPIICSDVPVYREIMKEYKCGVLVNPTNPNEIADAIRYLIEHKREAYEMGQEGRRAVIEKYSWDALSKEYIEIINASLKS